MGCDEGFYEEHKDEIIGTFNTTDCAITIFYEENTTEYKRTLIHEMTHLKQLEEGRLYPCSNPIGVIINEVEANLNEYKVCLGW